MNDRPCDLCMGIIMSIIKDKHIIIKIKIKDKCISQKKNESLRL